MCEGCLNVENNVIICYVETSVLRIFHWLLKDIAVFLNKNLIG